MRVPRVYRSETYVYRQNNYLNNSEHQVGEGCEFHAYAGERWTFTGNIIIYIIPNPK